MTDGPTDGRTDRPSYRDARTHLKKKERERERERDRQRKRDRQRERERETETERQRDNNKIYDKNNNNNTSTRYPPLAPKTGNAGTLEQRPHPVLPGALFSTLI